MFTILETVADNALVRDHFACDIAACRGACCTLPGGRGAPLADNEIDDLVRATPAALKHLDDRKRDVLATAGPFEGRPGDYATTCVDDRDCVFVFYDENIARCAIEKAWLDGEIDFRKPLSCHLFPIRIRDLFDATYLHYEEIDVCQPARKRGRKEGIRLVEFLREPIIRAFGKEFYEELVQRRV